MEIGYGIDSYHKLIFLCIQSQQLLRHSQYQPTIHQTPIHSSTFDLKFDTHIDISVVSHIMNTYDYQPQEPHQPKQFNKGKRIKRECFKVIHILQDNFNNGIYTLPPNQIDGCSVLTLINMSTTKGPAPHKLPFGLSAIYDMGTKSCGSYRSDYDDIYSDEFTDQDLNIITSSLFDDDPRDVIIGNSVSMFKPNEPMQTHWHSSKPERDELDNEQWYNIPFYEEGNKDVRGYIFGIASCANVALLYLFCNSGLKKKKNVPSTKEMSDKSKSDDINSSDLLQKHYTKKIIKKNKHKAQFQIGNTKPSKRQKKTDNNVQMHQSEAMYTFDELSIKPLTPHLNLEDDDNGLKTMSNSQNNSLPLKYGFDQNDQSYNFL